MSIFELELGIIMKLFVQNLKTLFSGIWELWY